MKKHIINSELDKIVRLSEIIKAILVLHSKGITYNDITMTNILYTEPLRVMKLNLTEKVEFTELKQKENKRMIIEYDKLFLNEENYII
mgnify:CR=1 FL=1